MAINYTKIGWDTSKYVNPTNMNQMDNGIKAACDGVDALITAIDGYVKLSNAGRQTIVNTSSDLITAFKSNSTSKGLISFLSSTGTTFGHIGVNSSKKPIFNSGTAEDEIALMPNVLKLSSTNGQTISATAQVGFPLTIKSGRTDEATIKFAASNDNVLGFFGIQSGDKPVFYGSSGSGAKEIALKDSTTTAISIPSSATSLSEAITYLAQNISYSGVYTGAWTGQGYFMAILYRVNSSTMFGVFAMDYRTTYTISYINGVAGSTLLG